MTLLDDTKTTHNNFTVLKRESWGRSNLIGRIKLVFFLHRPKKILTGTEVCEGKRAIAIGHVVAAVSLGDKDEEPRLQRDWEQNGIETFFLPGEKFSRRNLRKTTKCATYLAAG